MMKVWADLLEDLRRLPSLLRRKPQETVENRGAEASTPSDSPIPSGQTSSLPPSVQANSPLNTFVSPPLPPPLETFQEALARQQSQLAQQVQLDQLAQLAAQRSFSSNAANLMSQYYSQQLQGLLQHSSPFATSTFSSSGMAPFPYATLRTTPQVPVHRMLVFKCGHVITTSELGTSRDVERGFGDSRRVDVPCHACQARANEGEAQP